jgi:diguanylate cyclase (GGDEF)-like protein
MTTEQIASRYNVIKKLGEGGMGLVSLVEDTTNGQKVALKVLSAKLGATEETILTFKQEFRTMSQLQHPNCCAVYDFGLLPDGAPWLTMEVVPGHGLDELVPEGFSEEEFTKIFTQLLLALGYVHQLGFVHCDIKSENVRVKPVELDENGNELPKVKLMDFGLMDRAGSGGTIKGTLGYMAPEMAKGSRLDQRADIYSVGCLAYEMLTGQLPFPTENPVEILKAHINDTPTPPSKLKPGINPEFERVILKMMQKEPLARYQSCFDVLEDLGIEVPEGQGGNLLSAPFVGRTDEMAKLTAQLNNLTGKKPAQSILIAGPAGAGKSRLAEEFRFAVQIENLPYVVGASFEQGTAPYGPFVEVLKGLLPAMREHIPAVLEKHGGVLVKLLPELGVEPAPDLDPPSKEKLRLQATISEVFSELAAKKGTVAVLEDWHWADPLSAELLTYILRNTKESPLFFLLNYRGAVEGTPAWLENVNALELPGLTTDEIKGMITSMLGSEEIGDAFLSKVVEFAEGNPFFVEGLLEHLARNKTLVKTKGKWNSDIELKPEDMPSNLQGLLLEKLNSLSDEAMAIARIGAVIGREADLKLIGKVSGLDEDKLFDALDQLAEQQIFTKTEAGNYRFSQGQLQEVLYANIEDAEKGALHSAVAEALEAVLGDTPVTEATMEQVSAIANHYLLSKNDTLADKTIVYALEAGMRSQALFANGDAERFLTAGLELLKANDGDHRKKQKLDYLRSLADVFRVTAKKEESRDTFLEVIPLAEELGESFLLGRMLTSLAKVYQMLNKYPEALEYCGRSVDVCLAGGDKAGAARCLLTSSRIYFFTGKMAEAVADTTRALELARDAEVKSYIGEALGFVGYIYVASDPDKIQEGIDNLNQSVTILTEVGDKIGLNTSYNLMGNGQNAQGDFEDAWESFQKNLKICTEIGLKDEEIFAILNLSITAFELGNFAESAKIAKDANTLANSMNAKFPLAMALTLEAVGKVYMGELGQAKDLAQQALDLAREISNKYMEALVLQYQLEILLYLGRLDEAKACGDALEALIKETGNTEPESRMQAYMAEILCRLGDKEKAAELIDLALNGATAAHAKGMQVRALRIKSWLALQNGQLADAKQFGEQALSIAEKIGAKFQRAQVLGVLGEAALAGGQTAEGLKRFEAMKAGGDELGSKLIRSLALFGSAAANGTAKTAKAQTVESQKLLKSLVEGLDAEGKQFFFSLAERQRIVDGDTAALTKPVAQAMPAMDFGALGVGSVNERLARVTQEVLMLWTQVGSEGGGTAKVDESALAEAAEEAKARMVSVLEFAAELGAVSNLDKALGRSLDGIMQMVGAERGYLILESDIVNGQVMRSIRPDGGYQADWAFANGLTDQVKASGEGMLIVDPSEDERTATAIKADNLMIQTAAAIPVKLGDKIIGVLYLDRESEDGVQFAEEDLEFLTLLASQAAIALKNAGMATEMDNRSRQLEMLNELAEKINTTLVVEEVLDLVVKLTLEVTKADRGFLMLRSDENPEQLVCKAAFDITGQALLDERISMTIANKVLNTGESCTVVDATMDDEFSAAKSIMSLNLRTLMCVPLQAKGKSLGVLYVDSQAVVNTFTEKDLDLLKAIAGHSSGAIENATLYSSLNARAAELEEALEKYRKAEHEASTDMLTGLNNRRFFQDQSAREIELSKRHHRNMSVIMVDVDHFKKFNDTYGHAIGDEVLKVMGKVLPESVRVSDIPARFGGEEFVVLCPDTDAQGAFIVAERIRQNIMAVVLHDAEGKPVRQLTASLGISSLMPGDERLAEILERADHALYACKGGGRNQTQIWRPDMLTPEEIKKKEQKEREEAEEAAAKKAAAAEKAAH